MSIPNETHADARPALLGDGADGLDGTETPRTQGRDLKERVVQQATGSLRQARASAASSLNQSRRQAADRIGTVAGAVRQAGDRLRDEQQPGVADVTDSLADQVERASAYLRDRDLRGVRDDVEHFARRQPAVALGIALALGVIGARFLKSGGRHG